VSISPILNTSKQAVVVYPEIIATKALVLAGCIMFELLNHMTQWLDLVI
jgi:hypothetical protein